MSFRCFTESVFERVFERVCTLNVDESCLCVFEMHTTIPKKVFQFSQRKESNQKKSIINPT